MGQVRIETREWNNENDVYVYTGADTYEDVVSVKVGRHITYIKSQNGVTVLHTNRYDRLTVIGSVRIIDAVDTDAEFGGGLHEV